VSNIAPSNPGSAATPAGPAHTDAILRLLDKPVDRANLEAGAALAARPVEMGSGRGVRLLLFRIGEETGALHARVLRRVTPFARATPIPHRTAGVLRGVCNIRGELVLCADLHRLLGLPPREEGGATIDARRMVVIGTADNSWAFEVDALMGVESVDPATFRAPPVTVEYAIGDFTLNVTEIAGRCVTILDAERILAGFKAGLT
jgi:chemotaxis-related protein WspD